MVHATVAVGAQMRRGFWATSGGCRRAQEARSRARATQERASSTLTRAWSWRGRAPPTRTSWWPASRREWTRSETARRTKWRPCGGSRMRWETPLSLYIQIYCFKHLVDSLYLAGLADALRYLPLGCSTLFMCVSTWSVRDLLYWLEDL